MQIYDIYLDRGKPGGQTCVLNGVSSQALQSNHQMLQGDTLRLRIHWRTAGGYGAVATSVTLDAGDAMVLAGKLATDPGAVDALFSCATFVQGAAGADNYYEGVLDLNTAELATALTSALYEDCSVDVEIQNAANTERLSYRLTVRVHKQVYAGTEGTTAGSPPYPAPDSLALKTPTGGMQKEIAGVWRTKDIVTGKWVAIWFENGAIKFDEGVEG
jgi:hypothetical protein